MKVRELQELLNRVAQLPGGADREVVFMNHNYQHVCVEQIIPCNLQIGVDYSFEFTPAVLMHDWHAFREEFLEDCDGHIIKPERSLYSSPRHSDIKYNEDFSRGPRGGCITRDWKEKHEKEGKNDQNQKNQ